jgi:hypothetical protein
LQTLSLQNYQNVVEQGSHRLMEMLQVDQQRWG